MKTISSSSFLVGITLAVTLALGVGCVKAPSDAQVTSDIQSKLAADSGLQNKQVTVQAANGTVTLSGSVDNDAEREAAAKYAASAAGVKQVINNLQVGQAMAAVDNAPTASPAQAAPAMAPGMAMAPAKAKKPSPTKSPTSAPSQGSSSPTAAAPAMASTPVAESAPQAASAPAAPVEPAKVTIPSGAALAVRLVDAIDSATAQTGDPFHATLEVPVTVDGDLVIPANYDVEGHVVNAQASGKFAGKALLELQLDRVKVGERWYNIDTDHYKQETGSRGKNTAEKVGGGAAVGAILGGIFGGGKGAAIGAAAGAGAGGGVQAASKKPDIKLSSEKILTFTLQSPVTVVPTTKPAREGKKLDTPQQ
jgi:hypothetical protein